MKAVHFVTNFCAPALLYMAFLLYFMAGLCIVAAISTDPSYLVLGLIMFILAFNSWVFGVRAKNEGDVVSKKK